MNKVRFVGGTLTACSLLLSISAASADTLTPEQRALVKKYNITAADQKKLFGTPVSAAPVSAMPRKHVPVKAVAPENTGPFSTTYVWTGGEIYKSLGDRITNINGGTGGLTNSFGVVSGFNTGIGLGESPIRLQVGASYGVYDFKGRLGIIPNDEETEKQLFITAGFYKKGDMVRANDPISFGVVYDFFRAEQWGVNANQIELSQVRGIFGYAINPRTELGVWGTMNVSSDRAAVTVAGAPGVLTTIRAMNQVNFYVKQHFATGALVTAYVGALDNADIGKWQFGLRGQAPLSEFWSVYGGFNYVVPHTPAGPVGSGHEQWSASFGLTYHFGGNAQAASVTGNKRLPLLDVANNSSFLVTD
jgi:hypothetical protein